MSDSSYCDCRMRAWCVARSWVDFKSIVVVFDAMKDRHRGVLLGSLLGKITTRITGRRLLTLISKSAGHRRSGGCGGYSSLVLTVGIGASGRCFSRESLNVASPSEFCRDFFTFAKPHPDFSSHHAVTDWLDSHLPTLCLAIIQLKFRDL